MTLGHVEFDAAGPFGVDARFDVAPAWFVGARLGAQRVRYAVRPEPLMSVLGDTTGWYAGASIGRDFGDAWSMSVGYERASADFGTGRLHSDRLALRGEYRY